MVDVVYRIRTAPGKASEAMGWARKNLEYIKKAGLCAPAVFLLQPLTGPTDEITWVDRFTSMAMYEEYFCQKGPADPGWLESLKTLTDAPWYRGMELQIHNVVEMVQ
jgi:hypothetical protein